MARSEIFVAASREAVFEVLADPRTYAYWVPGSRTVRGADPDWPASGSALAHTVGFPPLTIDDSTHVIASDPPAMLELEPKARPLPVGHVVLSLVAEGPGTRVTMVEEPANRLLSMLMTPAGHLLLACRIKESLRRLKRLAEGDAPRRSGSFPRQSPGAR